MPRALSALSALSTTLLMCACSGTTGTSTAHVATTSQSPTTVSSSAPTPISGPKPTLRVPGHVGGEISRTVLTPGHDTTTVWEHRAGDRNYVVKAACSATGTTTLTYLLLDARASSESESQAERTLSRGDVPCDGVVAANSAGPLIHGPVTVTFLAVPESMRKAYAVVVPE
jgi:hypothetical protein